jgi:hypothetical protein
MNDTVRSRDTVDMWCKECSKLLHQDGTCHPCRRAKAQAEAMKEKRCCECRASEHENYDDVVGLCVVKDPETGKIIQRGYLCAGHVEIRTMDGYDVYLNHLKIGQ